MDIMRCFLLTYFVFTFSLLNSQTRIIGGKGIGINDAPWVVNIRVVNVAGIRLFDRSGVIISENLVLTASHNWPDYVYDHIAVHVGGAYEGAGEYRRVHRVIHHHVLDLALLELSEPLTFDECIQPIDYRSCADESLYAEGTDAVIYGWGATVLDAPLTSLKLTAVDVKIISREEANSIYGARVVPDNTIVSIGEAGICMAGKGDSGGPLVVFDSQHNPVLAGIIILADARRESQNSSLTVYAKVNQVIEWIDENKCEISGSDTVPPLGARFEIVNMPPDMISVEWQYSGLTEISSTANYTEAVSSEIESKTAGSVCAVIYTDLGTVTVARKLEIMPRIDIDINIKYNAIVSRYEMKIKTVNMKTFVHEDNFKCKNISDNVNILGFIWNYENETAIGNEAIFGINPYSPKVHRISVSKYACHYTLRLDKTFVIQCADNDFISVHNEPGTVTLGWTSLPVNMNIDEKLEMVYTKNSMESRVPLTTSHVMMEERCPLGRIVRPGNYKVSLYARDGKLLYINDFNINKNHLHINTSAFYPDIYILNIKNSGTNRTTSRYLIIN
jgi:hypothetical protein